MVKEIGRSLVETLGMLAIMGILSVVGLAGYNSAMDKNRANTLIQEAQKRATLVVPQIQMMNNSTPTLNEFANNDLGYATFDTSVYTHSNLSDMTVGQFGIKVSGVSKTICQNILNTIGDNTIIRRLSTTDAPEIAITGCSDDNTFLLVYNNDMGTNNPSNASDFATSAGCEGAGNKWCSGWETPACAEDCCLGVETSDCLTCSSDGTIGKPDNNTFCDFDEDGTADDGVCNGNGICEQIEGKICNNNTDCGNGSNNYFCAYYIEGYGSKDNVNPNTGPLNNVGKCSNISNVRGSGGKYVWSTTWMDFYSAENFCLANNMSIVSLTNNSFQCPYTFSEYNSNGWGYCCTNRNGITSCSGGKSSGITEAISANVPTTYWFWMQERRTSNNEVFLIRFSDGFVATTAANVANYNSDSRRYALCE